MSVVVAASWEAPIMKTLVSIRRSRTLRNAKIRTSSVEECWPCPEKSIGRYIAKIGRHNCWEAVGPARAVFSTISQDIQHHLNTYSEPTSTWITWSIYMVGDLPQLAVPTIIFCCEDETHRKTIRNMIRDSSILEKDSGIALKHLPRAPDYNQLVQLASLSGPEDPEESKPQSSPPYGQSVWSTAHHATLGRPLYVQLSNGSNTIRKATAGGVIRVCGKECLITAAHAFTNRSLAPSNFDQEDEDLCFSDSEGENSEITSTTSQSPSSSLSRDDDILSSRNSSSVPSITASMSHLDEKPSTCSVSESADIPKALKIEAEPQEEVVSLPESASVIGRMVFLSKEGRQPDLDYALIRLENASSSLPRDKNAHIFDDLVLPVLTTAEGFRQLESTDVMAVTASTGTISGQISQTPVFLRIPNAMAFQEVYEVSLEKPLAYGDCGSWVFNVSAGSLHGHIVAGTSEGKKGFIIPAYQIFDDIRDNLDILEQRLDCLEQVHAVDPNIQQATEKQGDPCVGTGQTSFAHKGRNEQPLCQDENTNDGSGPSSSTAVGHRLEVNSTDDPRYTKDLLPSGENKGTSRDNLAHEQPNVEQGTTAEELTSRFRAVLSSRRIQVLRDRKSLKDDVDKALVQASSTDDSTPPSNAAIRNFPTFPTQPVHQRSIRFRNTLFSLSKFPLQWEKTISLDEALRHIPLEQIYQEAEEEAQIFQLEAESLGNHMKAAWAYQDCVVRALLRWFKRSFFSWVENPVCSRCHNSTTAIGSTPPVPDEQRFRATTVELYQCTTCNSYERFPRYQDTLALLHTRRGRAGEWVSCFSLLCRAVGSRVRWVWNAEDHVWIEVYSLHRKRWVHADPCEEAWDKPRLYTEGWGMKMSYCIAFSSEGATDVTRRYVRSAQYAARRNRCSESELLFIMDEIRAVRRQELSQEDKVRLEKEHTREMRELRDFSIRALVTELCSLVLKLADGSMGIATEVQSDKISDESLRQSSDTNRAIPGFRKYVG